MMKKYSLLMYVGLLIAILGLAAVTRQAPAVTQAADFGMVLPENYREDFALYLVVDRPDRTVRHLYTAPEVVAALQAGEDIPYGAQLIIETYDARTDIFGNLVLDNEGRYTAGDMQPNVHMIEKRSDWTLAELPSPIGVIDWNFGSFDAQSQLPSTENRNDCMSCHHSGALSRDFVFSRRILEDYTPEEDVPYIYCALEGRADCIR